LRLACVIYRPAFALFLTLFLLTGCGSSTPQLDAISAGGKVLAFGDSLTFGTGVKKNQSYPSQLSKLIDRSVINAGIPGQLSAEGLARLPALLDQHQPELMILIHGGNDMLRKKDLGKAADNLRAMIGEAENRNISVVLMAVPNPTLILSPAEFYETVAEEMNVPIEVDAIADTLQYPANKSDSVHPNEKGYRAMAESLAALLKDSGAL